MGGRCYLEFMWIFPGKGFLVAKPTNIQASRCGQLRFTTDLQVELRKLSETKLRSRISLLHRNRMTVFSGQKSTKMSRPTDPYDTSAQRSEPRAGWTQN